MKRWWRDLPQTWTCHHPYPDRYRLCDRVEQCAWCKELRFVTTAPWLPVYQGTKPQPTFD